MVDSPSVRRGPVRGSLRVGVAVTAALAVAGLWWAKWGPYTLKAHSAATSKRWSGSNILTVGGVRPGQPPSWHAALSFASAYARSIWPALAVALVVSAAVSSLVPVDWPARLLNRRRGIGSALVGGLAALPSMMCTCCTAPVVVTLRRGGVGRAAALAYWLSNPLLNPAVLVFLAFVAPWQWTLTRLVIGALTTVIGSVLVVRLTARRTAGEPDAPAPTVAAEPSQADKGRLRVGSGAERASVVAFLRALVRLGVVLLPEYVVIVLLVGAARGWLLGLADSNHLAAHPAGTALLAAVAGVAMVIPTAGEIPILQPLSLAGVPVGVVGALLVTLPVVSLPGLAMVWRSLGSRVAVATVVLAIVAGLLAAAVLSVIL